MSFRHSVAQRWPGLIEAYRDRMPGAANWRTVTLLEGNTPLVRANYLSHITGCDVYLKVEGLNPTGSFKDRGMTVAVTDAVANGKKALICASTGNTSASAAAYATRAGIACSVLIPEGKIAHAKLAQAVMHGAHIIQVRGTFDDCLDLVQQTTSQYPEIAVVNSVNPMRIEGQKTAAFEVCDVLGDAPDIHALPVGNAGNITAYWKGYCEYFEDDITTHAPVMLGVQAAGAAPLVHGQPVPHPETIATAIRIGNPASWRSAIAARDASGGRIIAQTDERILEAYRIVAGKEGVFVEPASASSVAGVLAGVKEGWITPGQTIVCTVTGNGLKDPATARHHMPKPTPIDVEPQAVIAALALHRSV